MKKPTLYQFTRIPLNAQQGFALVSTVTVMILLLVIGLGVITLSSLSSKESAQDKHLAEAQANARMALSIALGQLQKYNGPDQRVTATASIFDEDPKTLQIDGVNHPSTLGVWSTVTKDATPIIYQNDDGYHSDHRNPSDADAINHKEQVLTWLISGSETGGFNPRTTELTNGDGAVTLGHDNGNPVLAPVVRQESASTDLIGGYAYHVTDLGMAAPIFQTNEALNKSPLASTPNDGGYANLYTGKKRPYDKLAETNNSFGNISTDEVVSNKSKTDRYLTYGTASINPDGTPNKAARDFLKANSTNYTDFSSALLVDTLEGKLKIDLSSYFKDDRSAGAGSLEGETKTLFKDDDPLIDHSRFRAYSPKFGILRDYMRLGNLVQSSGAIAPRAPIFGGGSSGDYPDPTRVIKAGVHPYIVEYSFYARPVINTSSPSNVSLVMYPRVTLWNPHNVALDTSGYFFQINQRGYMLITTNDDANGDGKNDDYGFTASYWGNILPDDGAKG